MRRNLMLFSTLLALSACQTVPSQEAEPVHWEFFESPPGAAKACLPEADVKSLSERLVRCERAAAKCSGSN